MRAFVPLLVGLTTGALSWALTGYFLCWSADMPGTCSSGAARALVVPGAVVGGILFVLTPRLCPSASEMGYGFTLVLGGAGGLGLGTPVAVTADYLMGMASTGVYPSFSLALIGTSMALGAASAGFGPWRSTPPPRPDSSPLADGPAQ